MFSKKLVEDYLTFNKRDRLGIIALTVLILVIYLMPRLFSRQPGKLAIKESTLLQKAIDSLNVQTDKKPADKEYEKIPFL